MEDSTPTPRPKISPFAIAGLLFLPAGFLLLLLLYPTGWPAWLLILLIVLGAIASLCSIVLGVIGIFQIRSSDGKYYGLRLALFLALFYPIILLDLFLFTLGWTLIGRNTSSSLIPLAWLLLVLLIDYLLVRFIWRRVNRPKT